MCPGPSCGAGTAVIDARRGSRGVGVPVPAQASAVRGDTALRPGFMGWTVVVETGKGRDGPPASPAPLFPASDRIPQGVSDPPGSVEFSACPRDQGVIENPLVRSNNCRCTVLGQDHPGSARSQPATKVCDREHRSGQSPLGSECREGRKWWQPEGRGRNEESPPGRGRVAIPGVTSGWTARRR